MCVLSSKTKVPNMSFSFGLPLHSPLLPYSDEPLSQAIQPVPSVKHHSLLVGGAYLQSSPFDKKATGMQSKRLPRQQMFHSSCGQCRPFSQWFRSFCSQHRTFWSSVSRSQYHQLFHTHSAEWFSQLFHTHSASANTEQFNPKSLSSYFLLTRTTHVIDIAVRKLRNVSPYMLLSTVAVCCRNPQMSAATEESRPTSRN